MNFSQNCFAISETVYTFILCFMYNMFDFVFCFGFTESLVADIQKKITESFDIFDHESNKTVDVR